MCSNIKAQSPERDDTAQILYPFICMYIKFCPVMVQASQFFKSDQSFICPMPV